MVNTVNPPPVRVRAAGRGRLAIRSAATLLVLGTLATTWPTTRLLAANLLDRWWDDLTGRKPAAPAQTSPVQTSPTRASPTQPVPAQAASQGVQAQPGSQPQQPAAAPPPASAAMAQTAPTIPVVTPKLQQVSESIVVTGNAAAVLQAKLIARVVGYLEQIHFEDGALVKKGDLLFTIQQDQYKAQLQQAKAQLQQQQAALSYAKTEVIRYTALLKKDAATQVDVDHWNYERQSAEAGIYGAQAQIDLAQLNLGYTEVRAPFDGQMGKHLIDVGNVVGGNGQEAALAEITQLDPIYIVANISSQQAYEILANLQNRRMTLAQLHQVSVDVGITGETGFPHRGTIEFVAPGIDPATGTLLVRALVPNPNRVIVPGVFANLRLPLGKTLQSALLIPVRSLQEDQGGRYAILVGPGDVLQKSYLQLGPLQGDMQVVTSGLKPDDRVVVGELWRATPGTKVVPTPATGTE